MRALGLAAVVPILVIAFAIMVRTSQTKLEASASDYLGHRDRHRNQ